MADLNQVVAAYRTLRDKKKDIVAEHKEQLAPYNERLMQLEGFLMAMMDTAGLDSAKTPSGTAYKVTKAQAKVEDREAFIAFCIKEDLTHLLTAAASKTAVEEYIEDTGNEVPGVVITRVTTVNVRK